MRIRLNSLREQAGCESEQGPPDGSRCILKERVDGGVSEMRAIEVRTEKTAIDAFRDKCSSVECMCIYNVAQRRFIAIVIHALDDSSHSESRTIAKKTPIQV